MKIIKYFFAGGIAAIVDISLFAVFAKILGYNYFLVGAITFLIATAVNYFLSIRFVFKSGARHSVRKEALLVYVVSATGLCINLIVLFLAIDILQLEMIFSKLLASGMVFFWNYFSRKRYIF